MTPFQVREETRHVFPTRADHLGNLLMGDWKPDAGLESVRLTILLTGSCENKMYGCGAGGGVDDSNAQGNVVEAGTSMASCRNEVSFLRNSSSGAHILFQEITVLRSYRIGSNITGGGRMAITEQEQHGKEKVNFRCSDVGPKNCEWQISGNSEAEIMPKIEQHGREKHNMKLDDETRKKVQSAMHRKAA
jgi:predicted small metal-binding protein